jgi:hypothetical protein
VVNITVVMNSKNEKSETYERDEESYSRTISAGKCEGDRHLGDAGEDGS